MKRKDILKIIQAEKSAAKFYLDQFREDVKDVDPLEIIDYISPKHIEYMAHFSMLEQVEKMIVDGWGRANIIHAMDKVVVSVIDNAINYHGTEFMRTLSTEVDITMWRIKARSCKRRWHSKNGLREMVEKLQG